MEKGRVRVGRMKEGGMACQEGQYESVNDKMEYGGRWNLGGGWEP